MKSKYIFLLLLILFTLTVSAQNAKEVKITTSIFEPFVIQNEDGKLTGFSIDLWNMVASEASLKTDQINIVSSIEELLNSVISGDTDIAFSGISMTDEREELLDFSHPIFNSGLHIMTRNDRKKNTSAILKKALLIVFSPALFYAFLILLLLLLISAHIIWYSERGKNTDFPKPYIKGIAAGFWWSAVTITTVGYGDKKPKFLAGRLFAVFWMFAGIFIMTYFTAAVTASLTINELNEDILSLGDLFNKKLATVKNSTSHQYLNSVSIFPLTFATLEKAIKKLEEKKIDALVYDSPALRYHIAKNENKFRLAGNIFHKESYAFALKQNSPLRDRINVALLKITADGRFDELISKWFGNN